MKRELKVTYYPDAKMVLVSKSQLIISSRTAKVAVNMKERLVLEEGLGFSGIQAGFNSKTVVLAEATDNPVALLNFQAIWENVGVVKFSEGCLSIPGLPFFRERSQSVVLKFLVVQKGWLKREVLEKEVTGILGICFQHEMGHLIGKSVNQSQ